MSLKVIVPPHPLIKHWLSILRDKNTPNVLYSTGFEQIGKWLTYEALRNWIPYKEQSIETTNGEINGVFIDSNYPIRVLAQIPEGLSLWNGAKELIPNSTLSLGEIPNEISKNEGVILYSDQITKESSHINLLNKLKAIGIESKRVIIIACVCSQEGLNELANIFPQQVIYTSCIDKENESKMILNPGIGNPILRLSTKFHEKN